MILGAVTLPVLGTLALGQCERCGRHVIRRSLSRGGRCLACRDAHRPRALTLARHADARALQGRGMHLALVECVRDDAPAAPIAGWGGAGVSRHPWRPLERVKLGFESELAAGLNVNALRMRLAKEWPVEKAVTTPMGAPRGTGTSAATPAPKKAKRAPAPAGPAPSTPPLAHAPTTLDPSQLLERLGFRIEPLGATPRGRLFLLVESTENA